MFVNSMSDLFHEQVPDEFVAAVFGAMARARQHTFQVLTKRPDRMLAVMSGMEPAEAIANLGVTLPRAFERPFDKEEALSLDWPLPNVWFGVSVEDQRYADERIPILAKVPAAVRFLSVEPLLGPVDLRPWLGLHGNRGSESLSEFDAPQPEPVIQWCIVGGESGPQARPCDLAWIRSIVCQCKEAGVPCFVKQCGSRVYDSE